MLKINIWKKGLNSGPFRLFSKKSNILRNCAAGTDDGLGTAKNKTGAGEYSYIKYYAGKPFVYSYL